MRKQQFNKFRDVTLIQPQRMKLILPAFILASSAWAGASTILAEYPIGNTTYISFRKPVRKFGEAFIAAVRYYRADDDFIARYKFWDDDDAVLYYPIYNGEQLGVSAVIEIWSLNTADFPTLAANKTLETSVLGFPPSQTCASCCTNPNNEQLLVASTPSTLPPDPFCNPFCDGMCVFS